MATLTPYHGLDVLDAASGAGGTAINDDLKKLADRVGPCNYAATTDPSSSDNESSGYFEGSRWLNTSTNVECLCKASGSSSATWVQIGPEDPAFVSYTNAANIFTVGQVVSPTLTGSSGTDTSVAVLSTYNQSSTASGTDLLINRTQIATGSGLQNFIDTQIGGASQFRVDTAGTIWTNNLVMGNGSAAQPCIARQFMSRTATRV